MLLDVSQPVTPETACFPGDVPFSCGWTLELARGASVNLGHVHASPHVGTHVDAPFHFLQEGGRVGDLALEAFLGPAVVVDAVGRSELDEASLRGVDLAASPRVLFKTQTRDDPRVFLDSFPVLTEGAVARLQAAGVRLVGIDAPSFDPVDAKVLDIHRRLGRAGIVNVENLALARAEPGRYELLAAPVLWRDMDAAPLRAVLRR